MKKRGFTLIELLAVIVVLAIIALIATPIVMNVIKNANMGAAERSADNYVKAVETLIATNQLDGTLLADGEYTIDTDGKLTKDGSTYTPEVSGTKPVGGTITIENGQVVKDSSTIDYKDYTVIFEDGKAEAGEKGEPLVLCKAIAPVKQPLFDTSLIPPKFVDTEVGVEATSGAPYAPGAVYQCDLGETEEAKGLIFYVVSSTTDKVTLILNDNIDSEPVRWCKTGDSNSCDGDGAKEYLDGKTTGWTKIKSVKGEVGLPSYEDINSSKGKDFLKINIGSGEGIEGYWTGTIVPNDNTYAYVVDYTAYPYGNYVGIDNAYGVRPVITIFKDNISL